MCSGFRCVVLLFYQPACIVADGAAEVGVVETVFYLVYKLLGGVGYKYVPAVGAVDAFSAYSGGNHHFTCRHSLDNLHPYATARKQRNDVYLLRGDEIHCIGNLAQNGDVGIFGFEQLFGHLASG